MSLPFTLTLPRLISFRSARCCFFTALLAFMLAGCQTTDLENFGFKLDNSAAVKNSASGRQSGYKVDSKAEKDLRNNKKSIISKKDKLQAVNNSSVLSEVNSIINNRKISPESLLQARGSWEIVDETEKYDPAAEHLKARQGVNVKRMSKNKGLSAHFNPKAEGRQDNTFRILKVEREDIRPASDDSDLSNEKMQLAKEFTAMSAINEGQETRGSIIKDQTATLSTQVSATTPQKREASLSSIVERITKTASRGKSQPQAQVIGGVPIPQQKPDIAQLNDISAEKLIIDGVRGKVIIPAKKPVFSKKRSNNSKGLNSLVPASGDVPQNNQNNNIKSVPIPRVKTDFMAVNLKSLQEANQQQSSVGNNSSEYMTNSALPSHRRAKIINLRSGEHKGKTRIVLDIKGKVNFTKHLDNNSNILYLDIDNAIWDIDHKISFNSHSVVKGYKAYAKGNNYTRIEIILKKDSEILGSALLGRNSNGVSRLIFDLKNR